MDDISIETNIGDLTSRHFVSDSQKISFYCGECEDVHHELMLDFYYRDDPFGWEDDGTQDSIDIKLEKEEPVNDNAKTERTRTLSRTD